MRVTDLPTSAARARLADVAVMAVSITAAALMILFWIRHLGRQLQVSTSQIGYPIYADFDNNYYFSAYRLVVVGFPEATLAPFGSLSWLGLMAGLYGRDPACQSKP